MKISGSSTLSPALLEQDFSQARNVGKVRLGEECLYFTKFSRATCLPYGAIVRAWLRQEEVNANLCCGRANFDQFYLMAQGEEGQTLRGQVLTKEAGKACLERIRAKNPAALIAPPKPKE